MELTLLLPGLAPLLASVGRSSALQRLLQRADRSPAVGITPLQQLLGLFDPTLATIEPPVGALTRCGEVGVAATGSQHWLLADPVHLIADQDRLYLAAVDSLTLTAAEASAVAVDFNRHFASDELQLFAAADGGLQLQLPVNATPPTTTPPRQLLGHDILPYLPQGQGPIHWPALINELQMLLHHHPINQVRSERGEPTINTLWFWGAGVLPAVTQPVAWQQVLAEDSVSCGVARCYGVPHQPLPRAYAHGLDSSDHARPKSPQLWVDESLLRAAERPDRATWQQQRLAALERQWFVPLWEALRDGTLSQLWLLPGGRYRYRCSAATLRRFWRHYRRIDE